MLTALLLGLSLADTPPPSYQDALVRRSWAQTDALIQSGDYTGAIDHARRFEHNLCEDASLAYLIGLSYRLNGQPTEARAELTRAVHLDATQLAAWSDLGELHLLANELEPAERAFKHVAAQLTSGEHAWLGPFRLAEIAAYREQPEAMSTHLKEALRRGFSFTIIEHDPHWAAFLRQPKLSLTLEGLLQNYTTPESLNALRSTGAPQ